LNLTEQYRPRTLSDIYGQDKAVGFFKSVIKNVDNAPRYFLISGTFGTGKSTLCRAFARDLLGSLAEPYYVEIDSGEKYVQENFDALKNIMFREVGGFKVVTLDECLHFQTSILSRLNGVVKRRSIGSIVTRKLPIEVLSLVNGSFVWCRVSGWHSNSFKPLFKYTFSFEGGHGFTPGPSGRTLVCTPNHMVQRVDGSWVPVGSLVSGDVVVGCASQFDFSDTVVPKESYLKRFLSYDISDGALQVVLGTLLGDGSFSKNPDITGERGGSQPRLSMVHGSKQLEYLSLKVSVMGQLSGKIRSGHCSDAWGERVVHASRTKTCSSFMPIYSLLYPSGKKFVSRQYLDMVSDLGLAVWFMDDGSVSKHNACLSVHGFSIDEVETIVLWFRDRWDICWDIHFDSRCKCSNDGSGRGFFLTVNKVGSDRLLKIIAPWVPSCMSYKLGGRFQFGDGLLRVPPIKVSEHKDVVHPTRVVPRVSGSHFAGVPLTFKSVEEFVPKDSVGTKYTYDLTVEGSHSYVAGGVLVHNCHLLGPLISQQLLKVVEDYYGPLFLFLATTDPQLLPDTLRSRMHHFTLSAFSVEQCKEYALDLLKKEGLTVSDKALSLAALNAQGHLRSMVKQVELILFQGEGVYLESYSSIFKGIEVFFTDFGPDDKASVEALLRFHPAELRSLVMYFFREEIINPSGKFASVFSRSVIPTMLANYLRLSGLVKEPDDYFSVLLCFRQMMRGVLKGKGL
jgi:DNA polymerase III gamma/tau subunit